MSLQNNGTRNHNLPKVFCQSQSEQFQPYLCHWVQEASLEPGLGLVLSSSVCWSHPSHKLRKEGQILILIQVQFLDLMLLLDWTPPSFILTRKGGFMKLSNWIWTFSAFDCNDFGPSVLFNLLLESKKKKNVEQVKRGYCRLRNWNTCNREHIFSAVT